jgi:tetratricopeptide (TPR) repeat protein
LVPSELPDQAGAVRDLVTAMKRSPTSEARTADLLPRAWIPALVAALLLLAYTLVRPGPALVGLAGLLLWHPVEAQRPTPGTRAMEAGDPARAAAEFLKEAARHASRDTAFYNAGTAALEAGRYDVARGALDQAARSLDPDLRYRALYNLGVLDLLAAEADSTKMQELLGEAAERLREALRLQPSSARAKWNLELAQRRQPPPPSGGGGGGGGGGKPPSGGPPPQSPPPSRPEPPSQGLSQSQAEQILNSMERRERQTREEQQRRLQGRAAGGVKDW